ncbi:hypothetical protein M6G65_04785 [Methylobacterium tardum]|uniref:hypothetical protein n=1 Tax=Methylobacterium tardum TaxID=374432 RepID=UPI0020221DF8|nr:hypothetical protein [Methylobacterium tardum]URD40254.1 hypothetical protein M6G65_04785 [Methylobacterium tardum]
MHRTETTGRFQAGAGSVSARARIQAAKGLTKLPSKVSSGGAVKSARGWRPRRAPYFT